MIPIDELMKQAATRYESIKSSLNPTATCRTTISLAKLRLKQRLKQLASSLDDRVAVAELIVYQFFMNMDNYLDADTPVKASEYWNRCVWLYEEYGTFIELEDTMMQAIVFHQCRFRSQPTLDPYAKDVYFKSLSSNLKQCKEKDDAKIRLSRLIYSSVLCSYQSLGDELKALFIAACSNELCYKPGFTVQSNQENNLDKLIRRIQTAKQESTSELHDEIRDCFDQIINEALPCSNKLKKEHHVWKELNDHLSRLIEHFEVPEDPRVLQLKSDLLQIQLAIYSQATYDIKPAFASVERLINEAEQAFKHEPTLWAELCRKFAVFFIYVRAALHLIKEDVRDAYLEDVKPAAQKTFEASGMKATFFGERGIKQQISELLNQSPLIVYRLL
jgi:hypothetical protein